MSLLSRLFGGGKSPPPAAEPELYNGYAIFPDPMRDGTQFRISARIEKEVGGVLKTHTLIRADTLGDHEAAVAASLAKARQLIDEQGERLFG
jgi:hypothetical protein